MFVVFGGDPRQNLAAVSNITAPCKLTIYYKHTHTNTRFGQSCVQTLFLCVASGKRQSRAHNRSWITRCHKPNNLHWNIAQNFRELILFPIPFQDSCQKPACYEKTVTLLKEPHDSLGMTVAGGMSSRGWDLPVYVTNVDPNGVVGQEGSICKGTASHSV